MAQTITAEDKKKLIDSMSEADVQPGKSWEYETLDLHKYLTRNWAKELNTLGKQRWELVTVLGHIAIFKRACTLAGG